MRKLYLLITVMVVVLLSACQSSEQIKPIKEETTDFDMNTAIEMIEKKEKMIIDAASREKVTNQEYQELEKSFAAEFGNHARDILDLLFIHNMDAAPESDRYVQQNMLYPTVFHKGITITSAVVYKSYYENEFFNQTRLIIREQYDGDDAKLKGWAREYIFTPGTDGKWELNGFSGTMNFLGEEYSMNYLELKL
ncbi:hypothetical protein PCCS19_34730 [Paenibacillus sp. CCS19]|uniref:hypothetical protein n=1 Tax=Paenibacillus sp. CCS19 TaxID=3158387 RepID=UPI00255DC46B|nr:hypothetical protein [Paenibacillus cellulosilyticus]GMK40417.1 hypothetical protein PCCS19_34730 [Paenibacillus cellulosilyticus]